jgi:predicted Fe-Mo cluster-binding NifX family protein
MTKIAVTREWPSLDQTVDPRFGRAAGFMVVDPTDMSFEYIDNGVSQTLAQGAGIQAAESVVRSGAKVLLTGFVGPKAFRALETAGIKIGQNLDNMSVGEAIQAYLDGRVDAAQQPNSGGHGR